MPILVLDDFDPECEPGPDAGASRRHADRAEGERAAADTVPANAPSKDVRELDA